MPALNNALLVRRRASSSLLLERAADPEAAISRLLGLQAQDLPAFPLSVRARTDGSSARQVSAALGDPPSLVRTWAMRGTLHLVHVSDLRWLTQLLGPRQRAATARRRRELGIPDERCEAALPLLVDVLSPGPLARRDIVQGLNARGFAIDAGSQAVPHLLGYAASYGLVCCGPGETFALVETWLAPAASPTDPLAELARRYLAGHGPADAADLAAWSGLPVTQARSALSAIDGELYRWETDSGPKAALDESPLVSADSPIARLLPRYDGYLLGWSSRDLVVEAAHRRAVHPGGGVLNATLTIDGFVRGTWTQARRAQTLAIRVQPFSRLTRREAAAVEADAADIGRFSGHDVEATIQPSG